MATIGKNLENIEKRSNHHSAIYGSGGAVHGGLDGQPLLVHHQHPGHLPCHLNETKMSKFFLSKVEDHPDPVEHIVDCRWYLVCSWRRGTA